jgi:putative transposase
MRMAHKFSAKERQRVMDTVNNPRFADLPPVQIMAILAEEEEYVTSDMTISRIMREEGLLNHRGRACPPRESRQVSILTTTAIHQVLTWKITLLSGSAKGQFYYLFMVMDVWSRRILGAEVHERECSLLALDFFDRVCRDEGIGKETATVLHSDNGVPMRSFALAAKLSELGVARSFSRPRLINDNAYA